MHRKIKCSYIPVGITHQESHNISFYLHVYPTTLDSILAGFPHVLRYKPHSHVGLYCRHKTVPVSYAGPSPCIPRIILTLAQSFLLLYFVMYLCSLCNSGIVSSTVMMISQ